MVERKENPKSFLSKDEKAVVAEAIRQAEAQTSGEICIYLERKARGNLMPAARKTFEKLGMSRTQKRNGVLIYLSLKTHEFAILGDTGIYKAAGEGFWKSTAAKMQAEFGAGNFAGGLVAGILEAGEKLAHYFPRDPSDRNELPDRVYE
ncbi:MAG: hypothetical protein A2Z83_03490 [Omnitrophica bacterium GWA2_52_8]|nr:MAG: hypothetical protein A2Z83_03490 [Omnitrophica bacterium GWA2_52_8]